MKLKIEFEIGDQELQNQILHAHTSAAKTNDYFGILKSNLDQKFLVEIEHDYIVVKERDQQVIAIISGDFAKKAIEDPYLKLKEIFKLGFETGTHHGMNVESEGDYNTALDYSEVLKTIDFSKYL